MTKTQQRPTTDEPRRNRSTAWALAALAVVVLAGAVGYYFAFVYEPDSAGQATPTTLASQLTPPTAASAQTSLEIIEEGVAAYYSGDADRAAELFNLADRTDAQIREDSAYQAAIGGRLTLNCSGGTGGVFTCNVPYHNAITDALGFVDHGDTNRVVVADGVITEFGFPEHSWINIEMGTFLVMSGQFDGYGSCAFGPFDESCAAFQLDNLAAWVSSRTAPFDNVGLVDSTLEAWYGGDCERALFLSLSEGYDETPVSSCSSGFNAGSSSPVQMIAYETALGAEVSVRACEEPSSFIVSCEVYYSNMMNVAVGKPPAVTTREFEIMERSAVLSPTGSELWYRSQYPEDAELRESFRSYAEQSGDHLSFDYANAGCATERTSMCADLILDNLDAWAAWYEGNA